MPKYELAVIEGRWFKKKNQSITPVFDLLVESLHDNDNAYFRHQFSDADNLVRIIEHVARSTALVLYVGAHGDKTSVYGSLGPDDGRVPRDRIVKCLADCWAEREQYFEGVYFGACSFMTPTTAREILCGERACNTTWVAGYSKEIDWMDSTLFDAFVLKYLLSLDPGRPKARASHTARYVSSRCAPLASHLAFQIYVRSPDDSDDVTPLVEY